MFSVSPFQIEDSADATTSSTGAPTTLKPSAVQHGNSSVAEELKMKFDSPSLKKVWDNPAPASMSSAMEHSTERKNSLLSDKNVSKSSMVSMGSCGLSFFAPPPPLSSRNGHRTSSMSSTTSSHTPGPSPGPILANVHPPYLLAPFPQSHLNPNPSLHALLGAGPNQSMQHAVTMGGQMANSPPILAPELRPAAYPQAHVPAQYGQGIPPQAVGGFHQNVVQTPTSPPTAMPQLYPANNSLAANQAVQQGPFPGPFGQMEQMNAFAAANAAAHQNPMHPMHFMPVQTGAAGQPANVAAFNQNVAMMNAQQAHAQQLFMAQLAHQSQQSQLEQMNKFSMAAAAAQSNVLANNILKPQAFVGGQPNAAAANHQAAAAALHHQGAVNLLQAQAQGTANWATASQAGAQGQQPPPQIAAQLAHFVQAQPGQPQQQQPSAQAFTRQPNPNVPQLNSRNPAIEQAQQQGQNALRSYFQANMLNMDAMQNHHAAQYMNHHHAGHHHPHEASRQQQAAVAAAALQQAASRQAVAPGQFAPNALNQSWANQPAHIQKHMLLQSMSNQRQFMQMFAANAAVAGQPGLGGNVPMGMAGPVGGQAQVVNNHRTSPSASMGGGGGPGGPANVYQPAPIQRPNNGPNGGAGGPNSKNNGQYSNRNGKFEERRKSGGGGGGGAGGGRSYYGHNRNSATPSPSGKSMVPPEMNGGPPPPPQGNNQSTTAGTTNSSAVECNVNKD